jgi:hypothetical protein
MKVSTNESSLLRQGDCPAGGGARVIVASKAERPDMLAGLSSASLVIAPRVGSDRNERATIAQLSVNLRVVDLDASVACHTASDLL